MLLSPHILFHVGFKKENVATFNLFLLYIKNGFLIRT